MPREFNKNVLGEGIMKTIDEALKLNEVNPKF